MASSWARGDGEKISVLTNRLVATNKFSKICRRFRSPVEDMFSPFKGPYWLAIGLHLGSGLEIAL